MGIHAFDIIVSGMDILLNLYYSTGKSTLTLDIAIPPPVLACSNHALSLASLAQSALSCVTASVLSVHASAKAPAESLKPSAP